MKLEKIVEKNVKLFRNSTKMFQYIQNYKGSNRNSLKKDATYFRKII